MDDRLSGDALYLHSINCGGCGECRGRTLTTAEARRLFRGGAVDEASLAGSATDANSGFDSPTPPPYIDDDHDVIRRLVG